MDVSGLPALVLDKLVPYLKVEDVLNCSMTSISWRAAFNQDRYWRYYLREYNQELINCLQNRPCIVQPVFEVPIAEGSELEPLCEWKINFMRTLHLKQNIQLGRYHVQELPEEMFPVVTGITGSNGDMLYYVDQDEWTVLNITKTPTVQTKFSPPFPKLDISLCHLIQDTHLLVIVQGNVLQVSTVSGNDFILKFRRLFDKPEVHSEDIPDTKCIDNWYNAKFSSGFQQEHDFKVIGHWFVAVACGVTELSLHVWNVNTGRKKNEVMFSTVPRSGVYGTLYECGTGKFLFDLQYFANADEGVCSSNIVIHDLNSRVSQVLHLPKQQVIGCITDFDFVVTRENKKQGALLHFYDNSTGKLVLRRSFPSYPNGHIDFYDTYFMYFNLSGDGYEVINIKTMDTVTSFSFLKHNLCHIDMFFYRFLFIYPIYADYDYYCEDSFAIGKTNVKVWMGNTQLYSLTLPKGRVDTTRKYYTKYCIDIAGYGSYIFNFW